MKIYGYVASINVRKVLWACEELSLDGVIVWESNTIVR